MLSKRRRSVRTGLAKIRTADCHSSRRGNSHQIEHLEARHVLTGGLTIAAIADQTIKAGAPLQLPINVTATGNNTIQYSVSSTNSAVVAATVRQSHEYLRMHVTYTGSGGSDPSFDGFLEFELFPDAAPKNVAAIVNLVNQNYYSGVNFFRISNATTHPGQLGVIQTGPGTAADAGIATPTVDNEITSNLRFTNTGVLAMARQSANDTGAAEMFISTDPTSDASLDTRYTIFGQLVSGADILAKIANVPTQSGAIGGEVSSPVRPVTIVSAAIVDDPQNVALALSAPLGTTGSSQITITANDGHGGVDSKTFNVTVSGDAPNPGPFLGPVNPISTSVNTPVVFQTPVVNPYNDQLFYVSRNTLISVEGAASNPFPSQTVTSNESIDSTTGAITITPPNNFVGITPVFVAVAGAHSQEASARIFPLFVDPAAPTSVSLSSSSDLGTSNNDNLTSLNNSDSSNRLQFIVSGVTSGNEVDILDGSTVIGTAVASGSTVTVTTSGTFTLSNGTHHITAKQILKNQSYSVGNYSGTTDLASNTSTELLVNVDTTAPVFDSTPTLTALAGSAYVYTAHATLPSGAVTYGIAAGPANLSINANTGVITWTPTTNQFGPQSITIKASSASGAFTNQTFSVAVRVTPSLDAIGGKVIGPGNLVQFTAHASDADPSDTFTYSLVGAPSGATIDAHTGAFSWRPSIAQASQTYDFVVSVTDAFSQTVSRDVSVQVTDNVAPSLDAIGLQTGFAFTQLSFTAHATDPNPQDTFTYTLQGGGPSGAVLDPSTGKFTWTPTVDQAGADYTITIQVTDAAGLQTSEDVAIHINAPVPPELNAVNPLTVYFGSTAGFTAFASDTNPNDVINYSLSGAPTGAAIDAHTGVFSWHPTANQAPGDYEFSVVATNAASLEDTTSVVIHVLSAVAPSLDNINPITVTAGGNVQFTAHATDVNPQDTFTYSLGSGAPAGANIDSHTGKFTWTPTALQALQTYNIEVDVVEAGGLSTSRIAQVKVQPPPPTIGAVANQKLTAGDALGLSVTASDATPSDTFTYSLTNAPAGATINAQTGALSWATAKNLSAGAYAFTVQAVDAAGQVVSTSFNVNVTASADSTLIVGASDQGIGQGRVMIGSTTPAFITQVGGDVSTSTNNTTPVLGSTLYASPPSAIHIDVHGDWIEEVTVNKPTDDGKTTGDQKQNKKANSGGSGDTQDNGQDTGQGGAGGNTNSGGKASNKNGAGTNKPSLEDSQGVSTQDGAAGGAAIDMPSLDWSFEQLAGLDLSGRAALTRDADLSLLSSAVARQPEARAAWVARAALARRMRPVSGELKPAQAEVKRTAPAKPAVALVKAPAPVAVAEPKVASVAKAVAPVAAAAIFLPMLVTETPRLRERTARKLPKWLGF